MDSRDLVSSGSGGSSSGGGGGGAGDEDGLLSVTAGLAKEASLLFQSRRFGECVDVLNQLLQKKEDDPKVLHNIVVAECFRDGCSDPRKLLELLNKVKVVEEAQVEKKGKKKRRLLFNTIPYISSMLENAEPQFVDALKGCHQGYTGARGDLSRASEALDNHEYDVLDIVSSGAVEMGRECEQSFMPYPSPSTDRNQHLVFLNEVLNVLAKNNSL